MATVLILKYEGIEPVSVNDMYTPINASKKNVRFVKKVSSRLLNEFKRGMDLSSINFLDQINEFKNKLQQNNLNFFDMTIYVGFPYYDMYYKQKKLADDIRPHDVSNYVKAIEDYLFTLLEVDDKYNVRVTAEKYMSDSEDWEFYVILKNEKELLKGSNIKQLISNYTK
jgi:Endodeoxyribonuclease RusA.